MPNLWVGAPREKPETVIDNCPLATSEHIQGFFWYSQVQLEQLLTCLEGFLRSKFQVEPA